MLKRVVRRALEARRNSRDGELSVTTPTKTPEKAKPIVAPAGGGIAARIAEPWSDGDMLNLHAEQNKANNLTDLYNIGFVTTFSKMTPRPRIG